MSSFSYYPSPTPAPISHSHHGSRRRGNGGGPARLSMNPAMHKQQQLPLPPQHLPLPHHGQPQQQQQQMLRSQARAALTVRDLMPEPAPTSSVDIGQYLEALEQWISFDLDDDLEFCPNLVVEEDLLSHSSHSEQSSQASSSPEASPMQQPQTIAPGFLTFNPSILPPTFQSHNTLPIHQPAATRAIAIIDPNTGIPVASPSPSVSPSRIPRHYHPHMGGGKW